MYIKSIVIDGFKSYAQRTEINGFDPLFNAITGLNGSGKSNILDAICFLLGITNLTHVRASNLQELVYKNGQAGVSKATVSITFENLDKQQSPLGYEHFDEIVVTRQVVIGGRNKYLINGSNTNNNRVQDLFHSVQLNVNNPHFLIMQGRITKVLNMKPPEILSMIEEAAGTRLYETKRQCAQRTIEKKDAKLREIDTVVKEDIAPTLDKLREERSSYLEYQKIVREVEHLSKLCVAHQFVCAEDRKKKSAADLVELQSSVKVHQERLEEIVILVSSLDDKIMLLNKKREEELGGVMDKLEATLASVQKNDAMALSALDNCRDGLKAEADGRERLLVQMKENGIAVETTRKDLHKLTERIQAVKSEKKKDSMAYTAAQKHFQAVCSGLSANDEGGTATLNEQLLLAKNGICTAETNAKQASMRLKHAEVELRRKEAELEKTVCEYEKDRASHSTLLQSLKDLELERNMVGYVEERDAELQDRRRRISEAVSVLQDRVDTMEARFPQLKFEYTDPHKGFDRCRVHGLVAKLVQVKDFIHATALEVTAGGKLYNVVVDTELTGKKLLQSGELKRRCTIIPLNKISTKVTDSVKIRHAKSLVGADNVHPALSLVGYPSDVEAAMKFVFGSSFVCKGMDIAKKVTYDNQVLVRTVTLEGNSFDPAGTLTGGARVHTFSVLEKLAELQACQDELVAQQRELVAVDGELATLRNSNCRYQQLKAQYDMKTVEADLLMARLEQSAHHRHLEEIGALKVSIDEQTTLLGEARSAEGRVASKVAEIEEKMRDAGSLRKQELKRAEDDLASAKERMEASTRLSREVVQEEESVRLELHELEAESISYANQLQAIDASIVQTTENVRILAEKAEDTKGAVDVAQADLTEHKELFKLRNRDISAACAEQSVLEKESAATKLKIQELQHKCCRGQTDCQDAAKCITLLLERYDWIVEERQLFGRASTLYDFAANDPKEAERRIRKLGERRDRLSKSVNMRAMNMLSFAEDQYADLMKKRKIVLNDKAKIHTVIDQLDKKKNEAVRKAWEQVDKDFGSIFSTLLPGTNSKLAPLEGQTVLDGLEVKVAFGNVWKESLSELSGGQRSLVALSLILAMLLFKPAPLYILDEVDAALDLSHTQNIGQMIRSHFKHSQFIVVSLKDGMFNNANILFKTKFVDGVSTVTRHVQCQTAPPPPNSATSSGKGSHSAARKRTPAAKMPRVA